MRGYDKYSGVLRVGLACGTAALLAACQTTTGWHESIDKNIDKTLEDAVATMEKRAKEVPPEVSQALLPPLEITLPEGQKLPLERRFDLTVNNAPAREVFMGLVEGTSFSMVLHPDVAGRLTLNLKNITIPEALDAIREVYGYAYRQEGKRIFILGQGLQTQLFTVNYLNFNRKAFSRTRVASGELRTTNTSDSGRSQQQVQSGGVDLDTKSEADFWKTLEQTLSRLIGDKAGRKVVVNPQGGLVIVTALSDELRVVTQFLDATHATVNRQVILEAKVVQVELSDSYKQGINWSKLFTINGNQIIASQIGGESLFDSGTSKILGNPFTLDPTSGLFDPTGATETAAIGGVFAVAGSSNSFTLFLELLRGQGDVKVLSSPRVSTVNNQKAVIKVGDERFFITDISSEGTTTAVTTTFFPSVTFTPFFSGVALDVTPQIDAENNIILHIHPAVTDVQDDTRSFVLGDEEFTVPLAKNNIQTTDNIVRAQSGQIIVIGGLMKEGIIDGRAGIPIVSDVPVVGNLFKHKDIKRIKSELVILLRPTIVERDQQWVDELKRSQDGIKDIRERSSKRKYH
jgi:MSHA biogenesis protein MshL